MIARARVVLEQHGAELDLSLCPLLHPPLVWAAGKWGGNKAARADGMLRFSESLIHKPLCQLEQLAPAVAASKKEAAKTTKELLSQYKNLHGFLGCKRSAYPYVPPSAPNPTRVHHAPCALLQPQPSTTMLDR